VTGVGNGGTGTRMRLTNRYSELIPDRSIVKDAISDFLERMMSVVKQEKRRMKIEYCKNTEQR